MKILYTVILLLLITVSANAQTFPFVINADKSINLSRSDAKLSVYKPKGKEDYVLSLTINTGKTKTVYDTVAVLLYKKEAAAKKGAKAAPAQAPDTLSALAVKGISLMKSDGDSAMVCFKCALGQDKYFLDKDNPFSKYVELKKDSAKGKAAGLFVVKNGKPVTDYVYVAFVVNSSQVADGSKNISRIDSLGFDESVDFDIFSIKLDNLLSAAIPGFKVDSDKDWATTKGSLFGKVKEYFNKKPFVEAAGAKDNLGKLRLIDATVPLYNSKGKHVCRDHYCNKTRPNVSSRATIDTLFRSKHDNIGTNLPMRDILSQIDSMANVVKTYEGKIEKLRIEDSVLNKDKALMEVARKKAATTRENDLKRLNGSKTKLDETLRKIAEATSLARTAGDNYDFFEFVKDTASNDSTIRDAKARMSRFKKVIDTLQKTIPLLNSERVGRDTMVVRDSIAFAQSAAVFEDADTLLTKMERKLAGISGLISADSVLSAATSRKRDTVINSILNDNCAACLYTTDSLRIKKFSAIVKDGYAYHIVLEAEDGREFESPDFVTFKDMNVKRYDMICRQTKNSAKQALHNVSEFSLPYILLTDVIWYENVGKFYMPDDITDGLVLTSDSPQTRVKSIEKDLSPAKLFSVAIYTDLLGLAQKQNNGIFETEVSSQQRPLFTSVSNSNIFLLHFLRERFIFRKFGNGDDVFSYSIIDSAEAGQNSNNLKKKTYYGDIDENRLKLYQRSFFTGELTIGIFNYRWYSKWLHEAHRGYLNLVYSANLVNTRLKGDSLSKPDVVLLNNLGLQYGNIFYIAKGFSLQINTEVFVQKMSSYVFNKDTTFLSITDYRRSKTTKVNGANWVPYLSTELRASYTPAMQANSTLFAKFGFNYIMRPRTHEDVFWQMQVGYNLDIADFFSKVKR